MGLVRARRPLLDRLCTDLRNGDGGLVCALHSVHGEAGLALLVAALRLAVGIIARADPLELHDLARLVDQLRDKLLYQKG